MKIISMKMIYIKIKIVITILKILILILKLKSCPTMTTGAKRNTELLSLKY